MSRKRRQTRAARRLLARSGYELRRINRFEVGFDALLMRLVREKDATVVLDVGANHGRFVDEVRAGGYTGRIISFEPMPEPYATIAHRADGDPSWEVTQVALGDAPGVATMRRSGKSDTMSSLLTATDALVEVMPAAKPGASLDVTISTVDQQVDRYLHDGDRPFLKIDVQGSELSVLRGAADTLWRTVGILTELSLVELYEGQALYNEVIDWLAARNFVLLAVTPIFRDRNTGQLLQVDALFGVLPFGAKRGTHPTRP